MTPEHPLALETTLTPMAQADGDPRGILRLTISPGPKGYYRLAQLDDYRTLPRRRLPHRPPLSLSLRARASHPTLPGTWGFGLWNDPFSLSLGFGGGARRLPALPNAAWFFFASPPNYLSLRDDLPGRGALAAALRSPNLPSLLLAPAAPAIPLLFLSPFARLFRALAARLIQQDALQLQINPTNWHTYRLNWERNRTSFYLDDELIFRTHLSPRPPLGLVLWVDNQFAALPPHGGLRFGTLPNPHQVWIEISQLTLHPSP